MRRLSLPVVLPLAPQWVVQSAFRDHQELFAGIQMSGHSHAGQVRFPLIGEPITVCHHTNDTAKGWTVIGNRILVVTRGLGSSGLPVRFNAPPQIMVLNVHPGPAAKVVARPEVWLK